MSSIQGSHPVVRCSRDFEFKGHKFSIVTQGTPDQVRDGAFSCEVNFLPPVEPQRPGNSSEPFPVLILEFAKGEYDKATASFSHPEGLVAHQSLLEAFAAESRWDWRSFVGVPPDEVKDYLRNVVEQNWAIIEKQILTHAVPAVHPPLAKPHHTHLPAYMYL